MGFPIMVRFAEEVTVYTSEQGTILVLQFDLDSIVKENPAV
jgi:anti-sigma regulatory factor (Ser/Thr protein kinase)